MNVRVGVCLCVCVHACGSTGANYASSGKPGERLLFPRAAHAAGIRRAIFDDIPIRTLSAAGEQSKAKSETMACARGIG